MSLAFKLGQSAQKHWHGLRGYEWLDKLERGVTFIDGVEQTDPTNDAASSITDRIAA
ncbi:hypothetical protein [Thioalkalivibrio sp. ALJ2]|uniref:hypothetical protein n=1 Tax=Thioalkalivibrio sp. ALJ2 TaxID=1261622 RepID=UPI00036A3506|nr:hypothetical protein [Thioalkalivibrio sp. ALJ2]